MGIYEIATVVTRVVAANESGQRDVAILGPFAAPDRKPDYDLFLTFHFYTESDSSSVHGRFTVGNGNRQRIIQASEAEWLALLDEQADYCQVLTTRQNFAKAYLGALSLFLRYKIPKHMGTFFHCAGVKLGGSAYLFLAPSATGKTTLARKAMEKGFGVLSDELVFVSRNGDPFAAHGTPIGQISDGPITSPIKGLFFLEQGMPLSFLRLSAPQAMVRAWADTFYRDQVWEKEGQTGISVCQLADANDRKLIFSQWYDLFSTVPCFEMLVPLDFDDWDRLVEVVAQG